ncbi:MAG: hypothetical protein JSW50_09670 [Candidatus Latescibacterota bacterium]|nr:MAG: hypothetical protein JSW50_09670 [Candidatus Latescibacterota bacterium]
MTAAGSGWCYLTEPAYNARLSYVSGGTVQLDAIVSQNFVATEAHTWGAVKSIYR